MNFNNKYKCFSLQFDMIHVTCTLLHLVFWPRLVHLAFLNVYPPAPSALRCRWNMLKKNTCAADKTQPAWWMSGNKAALHTNHKCAIINNIGGATSPSANVIRIMDVQMAAPFFIFTADSRTPEGNPSSFQQRLLIISQPRCAKPRLMPNSLENYASGSMAKLQKNQTWRWKIRHALQKNFFCELMNFWADVRRVFAIKLISKSRKRRIKYIYLKQK